MNLTITDDMIIKFITGGNEYTIDKMILNENGTDYTVYETGGTPTPVDWTQVTEVKMTTPLYQQGGASPGGSPKNIWFDTGVEVGNNQSLWSEIEFTKYQNNGDAVFGLITDESYISGSDNLPTYFYRYFFSNGYNYFDYVSNGRCSGGSVSNSTHTLSFGKNSSGYATYNLDGYTNTGGRFSTANYQGQTYKIAMASIGIRTIKIWSDYSKSNLLFDGCAALDNSNTPCIYDAVSNSCLYLQNPHSYSDFGALTYIE